MWTSSINDQKAQKKKMYVLYVLEIRRSGEKATVARM